MTICFSVSRHIIALSYYNAIVLTVTTEKPVQACLYQVKKTEKEKDSFKKKASWPLRQLKVFDAKYANKVTVTH